MLSELIDQAAFQDAIANEADPLPLFRDAIKQGNDHLKSLFEKGESVTQLVRKRSKFIDSILVQAWARKIPTGADAALIAVGGYGRGELHPASDIDLLILLGEGDHSVLSEPLSELLTFFWDIGLEVGHSVRNVAECVQEAKQDATVITTLMEARLLTGPPGLFSSLRQAIGTNKIWPSDLFFQAKWGEQKKRYRKYDDTISSLEPNVTLRVVRPCRSGGTGIRRHPPRSIR